MARAVVGAFAMIVGLAMAVPDADAARMGGGRSFGRQSPNVTRQQVPAGQAAPAKQVAPAPTAQPQPAGNRWLGPLGGLVAGLGIAALLSQFGLGGAFAEGLGSVIMLALLAFAALFVWRMLRGARPGAPTVRAREPVYSQADTGIGSAPAGTYNPLPGAAMPGSVASLSSSAVPWGVPADFDTPSFIRSAKVNFIRLQAAWDAKNLADIREFTTPEVFAEIRMQMEEDKSASNRTDVVALEAELLGIEENAADYLASVKFTGSIRENDRSSPDSVEEVWNLVKPKDARSGWLLAGIQQIH
jgi:predicted lipid-binding transport protein (Tim44 family)